MAPARCAAVRVCVTDHHRVLLQPEQGCEDAQAARAGVGQRTGPGADAQLAGGVRQGEVRDTPPPHPRACAHNPLPTKPVGTSDTSGPHLMATCTCTAQVLVLVGAAVVAQAAWGRAELPHPHQHASVHQPEPHRVTHPLRDQRRCRLKACACIQSPRPSIQSINRRRHRNQIRSPPVASCHLPSAAHEPGNARHKLVR